MASKIMAIESVKCLPYIFSVFLDVVVDDEISFPDYFGSFIHFFKL